MFQHITLSQLHRLCRAAADLFFPIHTETQAGSDRALRDTNRCPEQSECLSITGAAVAGAEAAVLLCLSMDCKHCIPTFKSLCRAQKLCNIETLML